MLKSVCAMLATAGLLALSSSAVAEDTKILSGDIESVAKDHVVIKVSDKSHKVMVNSETEITLDGKKAALTELKKGFPATVTAEEKEEKLTAKKITARTKADTSNVSFDDEDEAKKFTGTIKEVEKTTLEVTDALKKSHSFDVGSETQITLDGKKATLAQLKAGFKVTVTAVEKDGKMMAKTIAAKTPE
jgi:hypothetical protein